MIAPGEVEGRWIELPDRCVFRLSGPDRVRFLNGQVSNDVAGPLHEKAIASCVCSLKGKVEALVWVSAAGDDLIIDGELKQREFLFNRLDRYLIADDCELADETDHWTLIHDFRDDAVGPESRRLSSPGRDRWLHRGRDSDPDKATISPEEWSVLQVRSGVPESGLEITGEEFPAELGLDGWAVDFHKGCYLGQEVISRIQSVGRVKRALRITIAEVYRERGTQLRNAYAESGKATRNFLALDEKKFIGFGLYSKNPDRLQPIDLQPVACSETAGT